MELYLLLTWLTVIGQYALLSTSHRAKRDAAGALQIVNNHAQPIHADVKPEAVTFVTEKVTPPEEKAFYPVKSLRKSLMQPSKLDLARSISRVTTLAMLLVSFVFEFYPLIVSLYNKIYAFLYL